MRENIEELVRIAGSNFSNYLIYMDEFNNYILFESYSISKLSDSVLLRRFGDDKEFSFNKIRNATAYAILHKHNKFFEANKVYEIDHKLQSIIVDKQIHTQLQKTKDIDKHLIYRIKLQDDLLREKQFQRELNKYIIMADECQQRGFKNELTRSKRKQKEQIGD